MIKDRCENSIKGAVFFIDIDNFRIINDTLGYPAGDKLLKMVEKGLSEMFPKPSKVKRFGGDEFIIEKPHAFNMSSIIDTANAIMKFFDKSWEVDGNKLYITVSMGIALYPDDGGDFYALLKNAGIALNKAENMDKNNYQFFETSMKERVVKRIEIEKDLINAVKNNELAIYYQPLVKTNTGQITGFEALIRWLHPRKGVISPGDFIPLAEKTGLIIPIGRWILQTVCKQIKEWQLKGHPKYCVAINISPVQLQQSDFTQTIKDVLNETGIEPQFLELEITENMLMKSMNSIIDTLSELRNIGVKISLDDFGTGYSSLNYLKQLPINILKIDKTFIDDINSSDFTEAIIEAIIELAHKMNIEVTAEGVEKKKQFECLKEYKCDRIQGYLLSKPLPAEKICDILKRGCIDINADMSIGDI